MLRHRHNPALRLKLAIATVLHHVMLASNWTNRHRIALHPRLLDRYEDRLLFRLRPHARRDFYLDHHDLRRAARRHGVLAGPPRNR
jgi:hypothetical protein